MGDFAIRTATRDDLPLILAMIRELAEYERLVHEVVATEELLDGHLFGPRRSAEVIIGEEGGRAVAFALFFHNFSTFLGRPGVYLEDLYVRPECRGKGYGRRMLARLAAIAEERGCGRFEWWVLDWNSDAIGFYEKLGAAPMKDWTVYRMTGAALSRLAAEEKG